MDHGCITSIVIPSYNRAALLSHCLRRLIDQKIPNTEIIVVDDGSTDHTKDILKTLSGNIRAIYQANRGPGAARNAGVLNARGIYVKFIDSDDELQGLGLERLLRESESRSTREILFGDVIVQRSTAILGKQFNYGFSGVNISKPLQISDLLKFDMPSCLPLFPRSALLEVGGFNEKLWAFEDTDLALRLMSRGFSFRHVDTVVAHILVHPGERLSVCNLQKRQERILVADYELAKTLSFIDTVGRDERVLLGRRIWAHGRDAARSSRKTIANELFQLAKSLAGVRAWNARWPIKFLYIFFDPISVESVLDRLKQILARRNTSEP
jgi:glycosyltransferase involved in cell wall biosynthesis